MQTERRVAANPRPSQPTWTVSPTITANSPASTGTSTTDNTHRKRNQQDLIRSKRPGYRRFRSSSKNRGLPTSRVPNHKIHATPKKNRKLSYRIGAGAQLYENSHLYVRANDLESHSRSSGMALYSIGHIRYILRES